MQRTRLVLSLILLAPVLLLAIPVFAAPITYEVNRSMTNGSGPPACGTGGVAPPCATYTLSGTVTTDGTLGYWGTTNHFIDIDLTLSDGVHTSALTATNYGMPSSLISATADVLQYSFGTPDFSFFDPSDPGSSWVFCSTARAACWERATLTANGFSLEMPIGPGVTAPSIIGYVPEPGTAALFCAGLLGLAGARRARVRA